MNGINLTVVGNLTRDPDFSTVGSGTSLAKFSLAVERRFKSGDEWDKATSFIDVVTWANLAEDVERLLTKGARVMVSGRLDQQSWDDKETGQKRSRFEMTADDVALIVRNVDFYERKVFDQNQPANAGARTGGAQRSNGGGRPQPARRPAPQQSYADDSIWDN